MVWELMEFLALAHLRGHSSSQKISQLLLNVIDQVAITIIWLGLHLICPPSSLSSIIKGNHAVSLLQLDPRTTTSSPPPPKPLLIASPSEEGEYPLLFFLHGYLLYNSFYSQLLQHIASHGTIVVAPQGLLWLASGLVLACGKVIRIVPSGVKYPVVQLASFALKLYHVAGPDCTDEINSAAATTNWVSIGLGPVLPAGVRPNLAKAGLAGHSRGGKAAFGLALGHAKSLLNFSVLIGIDPVDGMDKGKQTSPAILSYVPRSLDLEMAVMVVGSGLGEVKSNPFFPPCAPKGVNHEDFFNECSPPACYFVPKDYGHLDMLDDETKGLRGKATHCLCKNGKSREPMRRFVGGVIVAFIKAYLEGDSADFTALRKDPDLVPLKLKTVEFLM